MWGILYNQYYPILFRWIIHHSTQWSMKFEYATIWSTGYSNFDKKLNIEYNYFHQPYIILERHMLLSDQQSPSIYKVEYY